VSFFCCFSLPQVLATLMLEQIFPRLKLATTYRAGEELLVSANGGKAKV
jgi:hypothetical protein